MHNICITVACNKVLKDKEKNLDEKIVTESPKFPTVLTSIVNLCEEGHTLELKKTLKRNTLQKTNLNEKNRSIVDIKKIFVSDKEDKLLLVRGADKPAREDLKPIEQATPVKARICKFEKKMEERKETKKKEKIFLMKKTPLKKPRKTSTPRTPATIQKKMNVRRSVQVERSNLIVGEKRKDLGNGRGVEEGKMMEDLRLEGNKIWQLEGRNRNFSTDKLGDKSRVIESASSLRNGTVSANLLGLKPAVLRVQPNLLGVASGVGRGML